MEHYPGLIWSLCRYLWLALPLSNKSPLPFGTPVNPEYIHMTFGNKKYRMSYTFKKNPGLLRAEGANQHKENEINICEYHILVRH